MTILQLNFRRQLLVLVMLSTRVTSLPRTVHVLGQETFKSSDGSAYRQRFLGFLRYMALDFMFPLLVGDSASSNVKYAPL